MCNDPAKDCFCYKAGECNSKLPGYCCYYPKPELVKEAKKPVKIEIGPENPYFKWAHQGFETRIAALT